MVALAVWGLAIVRGLARLWCWATYRSGSRPTMGPDPRMMDHLKDRTQPLG